MEAARITTRDRMNEDLATTKEQLAGALAVVERFTRELAQRLGKDLQHDRSAAGAGVARLNRQSCAI